MSASAIGSGENEQDSDCPDAVQFAFNSTQDLPVNNTPPAWWLNFYFGTNAVNAAQDADGDGYSTLAEYVAGTAPTDASSYLRVRGQAGRRGRRPGGLLALLL